ncbi:DinB family protein [Chitinophaga qingshengii]|uniref:Damage-inducible protein DinB n=1 Tax=Chitinophaga qingshengii TaxID=1569794 RepID=A0ABR7TJ78_9BACT|nr:DinB family protein [Chitinophaga qingshengii]MBC9930045.1 damage-inducible protein DinB [Chitinophaga qingshengii]
MKTFFKTLFAYNHRVNQQLCEVLMAHPDQSSEKALKLYNHILNGHQIWNNRIADRGPVSGIWDIHTLQDCKDLDRSNYVHTLSIIDQLDMNENIHHAKIKGKPFNKKVSEILFHIVNHSTYHRAQIATEFRQNGLEPLMTDFIFMENE